MTVRSDILAALALPANRFVVSDTARTPEVIPTGKVHVLVYRSTVTAGAQHGMRLNEVELWALTPKLNLIPDGADDDLDDALEAILDAIDATQQLTWTTAERTVWDDALHGYKISLSVPTT